MACALTVAANGPTLRQTNYSLVLDQTVVKELSAAGRLDSGFNFGEPSLTHNTNDGMDINSPISTKKFA